MADNRIEYSLGLVTGQFLGGLRQASVAFAGLAGSAGLVKGVLDQIESGAQFADLSKRTGESVESLVKLSRGFQLAGLDSTKVSSILYQMQKALGGVNDEGESTKDIFKAIGLNSETLRNMTGAEAIASISQALAGLDRSSASLAASKIFGRMGAQDMLQLARNSDDFAEGMERAADAARAFDANAATFDKLSDQMTILKQQVQDLFLKAAVPAGNIGAALIQGFKESRIGDIWELTLKAGVQGAMLYLREELTKSWEGMGTRAAKAVGSVGLGLAKAVLPGVRVATTAAELAQGGFAEPVIAGAQGRRNQFADELRDLLNGLARNFVGIQPEGNQGAAADLGNFGDKTKRQRRAKDGEPEANALERIGAIFGSGISMDYARRTANATVASERHLQKVSATLDRMSKLNPNAADWAFTA